MSCEAQQKNRCDVKCYESNILNRITLGKIEFVNGENI